MKIILLSDCHLLNKNPVARTDDAIQEGLKKFKYVLDYSNSNDMIILQAGDLFDSPRSWKLLPQTINLFKNFNNDFFCVYGQHDTYLYSEETKNETNLGILKESNLIYELKNKPFLILDSIDIYGCSYGQEIPKVRDKKNHNILVIHAPISDKELIHDYYDARSFLKKYKNFDLILCGDIHREFHIKIKDRQIINTGPLIRKTADDYNFKHQPNFILYDTETREIKKIIIPHQKAKNILSRDHLDDKKENEEMLDDFIRELKEGEKKYVSFKRIFNNFLKDNDIEDDIKTILSETMQ